MKLVNCSGLFLNKSKNFIFKSRTVFSPMTVYKKTDGEISILTLHDYFFNVHIMRLTVNAKFFQIIF